MTELKQVKITTYEDGLGWTHKGCGDDAYPITDWDGEVQLWDCMSHGLIENSQVERGHAR